MVGVDTPETVHPQKPVEYYGREASMFLTNLLTGEEVYVKRHPENATGKYGRTLLYLYRAPDGLFVNLEIIRQGYGRAYTVYPFRYVELFKYYEDMGFIERIAPGAATKALKKSDVRGLKNHDPSLIFARKGVNLTLVEDKNGVRYEATPVDTHNFRETAKEVDLGLLDGQSFGFDILADEWKDLDKEIPRRTIIELDIIYDVGPVTFPAYNDTTVALRSLDGMKQDLAIQATQDAAIRAQDEAINLKIDDLTLERNEGGINYDRA